MRIAILPNLGLCTIGLKHTKKGCPLLKRVHPYIVLQVKLYHQRYWQSFSIEGVKEGLYKIEASTDEIRDKIGEKLNL